MAKANKPTATAARSTQKASGKGAAASSGRVAKAASGATTKAPVKAAAKAPAKAAAKAPVKAAAKAPAKAAAKAPVKAAAKAPVKAAAKAPVKAAAKAPVKAAAKAPVKAAAKAPVKAAAKAPVKAAAKAPAKQTAPAAEVVADRRGGSKGKQPGTGKPSGVTKPVVPVPAIPPIKGHKDGVAFTKDFDAKFLQAMRTQLLRERDELTGQANRLEDEANALVAEAEMGDVQFDDEGGEGDTMVVERERALALSAQDRQVIADIEAALTRIQAGTYGYSVLSGRPIPRERLEAIPWADVLVEEKAGGLGRR